MTVRGTQDLPARCDITPDLRVYVYACGIAIAFICRTLRGMYLPSIQRYETLRSVIKPNEAAFLSLKLSRKASVPTNCIILIDQSGPGNQRLILPNPRGKPNSNSQEAAGPLSSNRKARDCPRNPKAELA